MRIHKLWYVLIDIKNLYWLANHRPNEMSQNVIDYQYAIDHAVINSTQEPNKGKLMGCLTPDEFKLMKLSLNMQ